MALFGRVKNNIFLFLKKNSSNAKAIWEQINALTDRSSNDNSNCIFAHLNPNEVKSFFANLGPSTIANMSQAKFHHTKYVKSVCNSFNLTIVTKSELFKIIHSLASKSSSGFDGVSIKNLKLIYPYIAAVLIKIIIKSLENGIFPDFLKIAHAIALYKGGDVDQLVNFKPISLL